MNQKEWNEGLNHLDPDLIENYITAKEELAKKKQRKSLWLRSGALAACFALILGTVITLYMMRMPAIPSFENAQYSAEEIAGLFGGMMSDSVATNVYRKVFVEDVKYLYINPLPTDEYLNLYQRVESQNSLNEKEFRAVFDRVFPKLSEALGGTTSAFQFRSDRDSLLLSGTIGPYTLNASQRATENTFTVFVNTENGIADPAITLDGKTLQIDQRQSDEEIIQSLQPFKNKLFEIFGVSFSDVSVGRDSGRNSSFSIYFYNKNAHPLNATRNWPISDNIYIHFSSNQNDILTAEWFNYTQMRDDEYIVTGTAKKISLSQAEALLYNGCVFGGHSCELCMENQEKISFGGYDYVDIVYHFGKDAQENRIGIPFYAFYKNIGIDTNGDLIYAQTLVPAIEVSGYREYFEKQKESHPQTSN